jgi:hypothetical protein
VGKTRIINLIVLFLFVAIPETIFSYWLHHPSQIPSFLLPAFRQYYGNMQRNIIQFNSNCSIYDSSLFYILKPSSSFIFKNYEFSDSFQTNKMGLRDVESALSKPEIICLGDSYAMGWGVEQQHTFAKQLSRMSGKKVLNAAISSFGTAREMKNLYRLDTSALRYIIIQYSRNDAEENRQFVQNNYSLKVSSGSDYKKTVHNHYWSKLWFPGKHFLTISRMYAAEKINGLLKRRKNNAKDAGGISLRQSAGDLLNILAHSAINFKTCKVYVNDINESELMDNDFISEAESISGSSPYKEHFNGNLQLIRTAGLLTGDDHYILDDHLRFSGHQKIADLLNKQISP